MKKLFFILNNNLSRDKTLSRYKFYFAPLLLLLSFYAQGSPYSVTGTLTVTPVNTSITVSSLANPACFNTNVILTGTIDSNPSGLTGTVEFFDSGISLGTATVSNGSAAITVSSLSVGTHSITAIYSGDSNYNTSSSPVLMQTVDTNVTISNAGPDQADASTCGTTTVTLAANNPVTGTGYWSIVSGTGGSFSDAASETSGFSGNAGTAYILRWTITNGSCTSSDDVNITFNQNATTANAGPDQTGAATCDLTSVTLAGNTPSAGTGAWSIISGTGGTITSPSSPTSTFSGIAGNTYTLRWTISNSPCTTSTDDVAITFNKNPTAANAGPDQTSAATCGLTSVTLAGNTPSAGTGAWSIISGTGGTITSPSSPTSTFTGTAGNTYTLRWTISNSPCTASIDDVVITFNQFPATAAISYAGTPFCTSVSTAQNVTQTGTAGGAYSSTAGLSINGSTGAINPSASTPASYTITYAFTNGVCSKSTTTTVTITALPTANISYPSASYCKASYGGGTINVNLTGTGAYSGGTYTASPSGLSIITSGANAGRINPSLSTAGVYTVTYTNSASGGCAPVSTSTTVSVGDPIVNNNPILKLACTSSTTTADIYLDQDASVLSGGDGTYTYVWEFSNSGSSGPWAVIGGNTSYLNIVQTAPGNKNGFYRRTVISGGCSNTSSNSGMHVNVSNSLLAATYTITGGNYCITANAGSPVGLSGSAAPANGISVAYQLYKNGTYTAISVLGDGTPISFGNQFAGTYTVKAIISVAGGSSCPAMDLAGSLAIAADAAVPVTSAGTNQSLCNITSATLAGSSPSPYSGVWTLVSGTGSITNSANAGTTVTGLATGNNIFKWKISNGTCADSSNVVIAISRPTVVPASINATAGIICNGSTTTLTQNGGTLGTGAYWQWYTDAAYTSPAGSQISTANATLSVNPSFTTTYYLRAEGNTGPCAATTIAGNILITVNHEPAITSQPAAAAVCSGLPQTFSVTATGTALSYQWRKGGVNIPGATASTYNIASVATNDAGSYDVVISGTCLPNVISTGATLVVNTAPSITTNPVSQTVCSGDAAGFSVTVAAGSGTELTYQWKKNGTDISGATAASYNIDATASADAGNYTVAVTCCGTTVNSPVAALSVSAPGTWLGINTNWNDTQNWCGSVIPVSTTDIIIPITGSSLYPVVITSTVYCRNIIIAANASVILNNATMKIGGTINNSGMFDASNGTIEMSGTSAQTIPAGTFLNNALSNLIISNTSATGVTFDGALDIYGSLTFSGTGKKLITNDNLTFKSTATATAWLGDMTGNTITGKATVERYVSARKAWRFLSIPTNTIQTVRQTWQEGCGANANCTAGYGTQITGAGGTAAGFDLYSALPSVKTYNPATNTWVGITATTNTIKATDGYMVFVRGDRSVTNPFGTPTQTVLRTKGNLYTGDQAPITVSAGKFTSIGNPYPSALDMRNITKTGVKDFFYLWDPALAGSNGYGAYQTFSNNGSGNYVITPGGGSYGGVGSISNYIASGQAFFVQGDTGGGSLTLKEGAKTTGSGVVSTPQGMPLPQLRVTLYGVNADKSTYVSDGLLINYDDSYSNTVDDLDAIKSVNTSENLSVKIAGKLLVVERRHTITGQDTIFLNLTGTVVQKYRFEFTADQVYQPGLRAFLQDNYLHTSTELNIHGTTDIDFTIVNMAGSYAANRFMIVFSQLGTLPVTFTELKAYQKDKNINVEWKVDNELNIKQYEVEKSTDGNLFTNLSVTAPTGNGGHSASYLITDTHPAEGYNYYRIKSVDDNGKTAYSTVVKVMMGSTQQDITVYPNPVKNGIINLHFNNQPAGIYDAYLINKSGQVLMQKQIDHANGSRIETLQFDQYVPPGIYQLEIAGPDGTITNIKVIY